MLPLAVPAATFLPFILPAGVMGDHDRAGKSAAVGTGQAACRPGGCRRERALTRHAALPPGPPRRMVRPGGPGGGAKRPGPSPAEVRLAGRYCLAAELT